ncbi:MAG: TonB-dependent receptor plug domain-containing protein [Verrucomicrobiae bacterium]|nr:TonB-dependent receptor plug domain-containing protein [Verrucomicrobiae bacterium]
MKSPHLFLTFLTLLPAVSHAQSTNEDPIPTTSAVVEESGITDTVVVVGKAEDLLGSAPSSSKGQANNEELSQRPVLRRGELLEAVPGVVITQHSGGGKANQYFVRGFNLDHGTDFHVSLDGMPVNFRTHAHGQGYADLNFLIPEFIERLDYFKGPFYPQLGDLSTAGGAQYRLFQELPTGIASVTVGENDYYRALLGDSWNVGAGVLTLGGEYTHENGPWTSPDGYQRYNGLLRYHLGDEDSYLNFTAMSYIGEWDATDQVPQRAIRDGRIGRFDAIDPSGGGETSRHSLQMSWQEKDAGVVTHADAWVGYYDLDLFSNFTYFLNDPINGDQFEQKESRIFAGANLWRRWDYDLAGLPSNTTLGFQTQHDWIDGIGLHLTKARKRLSTVRQDDVYQGSFSLYADHETQVTPWMRTGTGLRGDLVAFDVDGDPTNSGDDTSGILSPKAHLIFGPWAETEFYINGGLGFHSNDARGVTISTDPLTGESVSPVDPLVRTEGLEMGLRTQAIPDLTATISLWGLRSDSEFVYVGDAGTTEAGPGSERYGIELASYWRPTDWLSLDAEYAWSHARFLDVPSGEDYIPNSIEHMVSAGITAGNEEGIYASLRARYFSPRPLEESGTIKGDSSLQLNARVGYRRGPWEFAVDCLNLLDRDDNDIEYFYESRLPGEDIAGIGDTHIHPAEPRQVRVSATYRW